MLKLSVLLLLSVYTMNCCGQSYHGTLERALELFKNAAEFNASVANSNLKRQNQAYEAISDSLYDFIKNYDLTAPTDAAAMPNVSMACMLQGLALIQGVQSKQMWALSLFDSFGKPPSGILEGNTLWNGQYDQCLSVSNETLKLTGKYYRIGQPAPIIPGTPSPITLGVCLPDQCTKNDIVNLLDFALESIPTVIKHLLPNITFDESYVQHPEPLPLDRSAKVAIVITSILGVIVFIGTVYDLWQRAEQRIETETQKRVNEEESNDGRLDREPLIAVQKEASVASQLLIGFSAYTNSINLFRVQKVPGQIDCLHGIRVISLLWVILGHTFLYGIGTSANPAIAQVWLQRFSFMILSNAFFSVDSFFLLSGLLSSYLFIKHMASKDYKITPAYMIKFYIHRLWRITPPLMLIIMFTTALTPFIGSGPIYPYSYGLEWLCRDNWWANLLYINNLRDITKMCFGVTWYLGNDMQFHWLSPILLIPLALGFGNKIPKFIGLSLAGVFIAVNFVSVSIIIGRDHSIQNGYPLGGIDFFNKIYDKPYCRIGPFVVGILVGYYLHVCKTNPHMSICKNKFVNLFCWTISLFMLGLLLFGIYPDYNGKGHPLSLTEHILYQATSRTVWAAALGFIIFACATNKGGVVNDVLSWPVWVPLSRLNFCAYLIHIEFIQYYNLTQEQPPFYQEVTLAYTYVGHVFMAYFGAYLANLVFELPLLGLEKFIFKK